MTDTSSNTDSKYKLTVGLEIHAELKTATKMFSPAQNNPDEKSPNQNVHPIDLGHPGTLPTINKEAVLSLIKIGLAVGGEIASFTEFDRKNYFYPDIPKGYQISQYKYPIVSGGRINDVDLTRIHLEEDTGTSKHDEGDFSLVDYNRAGVPLMELVTEPVIHSKEQAVSFAKNLQLLLRTLGIAEANMEKGEMRVEANISISDDPEKLGTKVEVKNLNSFKAVANSIEYEVERMTELLEAGKGDEIIQETRGYDENTGKTFSQRVKETSDDYRYFPEPDLPKMNLHEAFDLKQIESELPELPWDKKERYVSDLGLSEDTADILVSEMGIGRFFESVVSGINSKEFYKLASNYITSDLVSLLIDEGSSLPSVKSFQKLIQMTLDGDLSSRGTKDTLAILVKENDADPEDIANEKGFIQKSDEGEIRKIVEEVVAANPGPVEEYKNGKEASLQFLIGQGMKISKGSANPQVLAKLFKEVIS